MPSPPAADLLVVTPIDFRFGAVVNSHGWERLAPFSVDADTLVRVERLPSGVARLTFGGPPVGGPLHVRADRPLTRADEAWVRALVRRCFSLDWDLAPCYAAVRGDAEFGFIADEALGRHLVAPTLWEDLVKVLLMTNTRAAHTTLMAARLCALGDPLPDGSGSTFPTPEQVLALNETALAEAIGTGYRTPHLLALAAAVHEGRLDPEALRDPALSDDEVAARVQELAGFGPFAAAVVLRLLGRFSRVESDAAVRRYARGILGEPQATDADFAARYARFGDWAGMVMWWDVTRYADAQGGHRI